MTASNGELAELVLADLGRIVDLTRTAYLERFPGMGPVPADFLERTLAATHRTIEQFCRYYVEGTIDVQAWRQVGDATIERAGETFSAQQILDVMDVARGVGLAAVRDVAAAHPELAEPDRARVADAIDRFVTEIASYEDRLRPALPPQRWDVVLAELEKEGADLL